MFPFDPLPSTSITLLSNSINGSVGILDSHRQPTTAKINVNTPSPMPTSSSAPATAWSLQICKSVCQMILLFFWMKIIQTYNRVLMSPLVVFVSLFLRFIQLSRFGFCALRLISVNVCVRYVMFSFACRVCRQFGYRMRHCELHFFCLHIFLQHIMKSNQRCKAKIRWLLQLLLSIESASVCWKAGSLFGCLTVALYSVTALVEFC